MHNSPTMTIATRSVCGCEMSSIVLAVLGDAQEVRHDLDRVRKRIATTETSLRGEQDLHRRQAAIAEQVRHRPWRQAEMVPLQQRLAKPKNNSPRSVTAKPNVPQRETAGGDQGAGLYTRRARRITPGTSEPTALDAAASRTRTGANVVT